MGRDQNKTRRRDSGFSLIELMIVVAIVGILATIVVPSFQRFVHKVKINHAKSTLSTLYAAEKAFFAEFNAYTSRLDTLGFDIDGKTYFDIGFDVDFAPPPFAPQGSSAFIRICSPACTLYNTNSRCKVDQGAREEGAEAYTSYAARADRPSNDGLRSRWNWCKAGKCQPEAMNLLDGTYAAYALTMGPSELLATVILRERHRELQTQRQSQLIRAVLYEKYTLRIKPQKLVPLHFTFAPSA